MSNNLDNFYDKYWGHPTSTDTYFYPPAKPPAKVGDAVVQPTHYSVNDMRMIAHWTPPPVNPHVALLEGECL